MFRRLQTVLQLLLRANSIFENLEQSLLWNDVKIKWPESQEGKIVRSGDDLLCKAQFAWFLYEHSLISALQDLLSATVILPGFAQVIFF